VWKRGWRSLPRRFSSLVQTLDSLQNSHLRFDRQSRSCRAAGAKRWRSRTLAAIDALMDMYRNGKGLFSVAFMLTKRKVARAAQYILAAAIAVWLAMGGFARADDDVAKEAELLPPAPLHEQVLSLPGDRKRPVMLQVTYFTPDGPGPFPLAIVNHGASSNGRPEAMQRYRLTFAADYFLSRGYAVALPMMRGFAGSPGPAVRRGCDVAALGLLNGRDIAAVIDALAERPEIDASRIVVSGQSMGGWNTLAFGLVGHAGVKGLVNFSGGVREGDCAKQDASLIAAAASLGRSPLPSIWFYGDNDKVFPHATWQAMYDHYIKAGGRAELVAYGSFMDDAHQMLSHPESLPIWAPRLDGFLARVGLPSEERFPAYLPIPIPPPTHYAAVADEAAVPYLNEAGRNNYRQFLTRRFLRAFVVTPKGETVAADGGFDAIARALGLCRRATSNCQLYAVDDQVVWNKTEAPIFHAAVASGATATLNFSFSVNRDCSSKGLAKVWITEAPQHGATSVEPKTDFPKFPAASPFAPCNSNKTPGIAVEYTPASNYAGPDALTFEEIDAEHVHRIFRIALTVK
jgi:dienelactone hydrolase